MASNMPAKIGKYDVVDVIGRGGMGVVYKATDPHLDRLVAIKMMTSGFSDNPDLLKRFFREAQSLGGLQHPNIVTVYDLGDFGGNPYLVMQFLEGEGLDSVLLNRRQLSLLDKITITIQVCHGLSYAHRRGVVHRDIKPANIMLAKDGSVKIFDFGIAHVGQQNVTRTGQIVGTLSYMSPEQVNAKPVDARTDLFSTGVVLYQLFTSHLPFEGESTATTLLKIVHEPPPPLRNFLPSYPVEMENILLRALAKDPDDRYSSADEFALDLSQLQGQLKQELIGQEMQEVAQLLDRGDIYKAQDSLLRVLKIDQHQANATRLLREVQHRIKKEEIAEQVKALRQQGEEALSHEQFETAQECLERALGLDRNNRDLQQLFESVRTAALRAEKLHNALKLAESAHLEGKLETAKEAAEEALELAPDDTQAKSLYRMIYRDLAERSRQRQMESYLFEARQEISSRRFTAALDILKQAEALDPAAPQVHALIESAVAGREQERRRKELEAITHEVEEALNRDDYRTACLKADDGLSRFPEEKTLLKLKALAERQSQIEERKQFIDEQLAVARKLLQENRNEELAKTLEAALAKIGSESRLQSLLTVVRENVQRERLERRKSECLQKATDFLRNQAHDDAIRTLEAIAKEITDDAEIHELLAKARSEKAALVQGAIRRAQDESVLDLRINILEEALQKNPQEADLQQQLHSVKDLGKLISSTANDARSLEQARQYDQALAKWEALRSNYRHYPDLDNIIERVKGLREHARADSKANWVGKIKSTLITFDYVQASALLEQAAKEFPWDPDLMDFKEKVESGLRLRAKAQKTLADGQKSLAIQEWEEGAETVVRAWQMASHDPLIRDRAAAELLQASRAALEKNWRASEIILQRLTEIQPTTVPADLRTRIQERRREEVISGALDASKKMQASGNLQGALRGITQALSLYSDDRRLTESHNALRERIRQAEELSRHEKARREKEAFVQDAIGRSQQELALDARIQILEEALRKEPRETRLEQHLSTAQDLRKLVLSIVKDARNLEEARQYDQALAKWETLRATFRHYPDLDHIIEQARNRHQQVRSDARANWIRMIQGAFIAADYERASDVLGQAKREFPGDRELAEIEDKVRDGLARRIKAQKILDTATKAVGKDKWSKASESFQLAWQSADSDLVLRDQVLRGLLQAADTALRSDCESAEHFFSQAEGFQPESPLLAPVKTRIETYKRGLAAEQCLKVTLRYQVAGDFQAALCSLDRGLAEHPTEPRLLECRAQIQNQLRRREEEQAREREQELRRAAERAEQEKQALASRISAKRRIGIDPPIDGPSPADGSATRIFAPGGIPQPIGPSLAAKMPDITPEASQAQSENLLPGTVSSLHALPTNPNLVGAPEIAPTPFPPRPEANPSIAPGSSEPTSLTSVTGSDALQDATLRIIERQLATFIGPLAKVLVKRAASKTHDPVELYRALATNLDSDADRQAFLARAVELTRLKTTSPSSKEHTQIRTTAAPSNTFTSLELTPDAIEHAARMLAAHVGPISGILAKKAAKRADNLRSLYLLLAEHVEQKAERSRFLKDAGFPDS